MVRVPSDSSQAFGSLYQVSCEHDEIFANSATVNDVEIIDAITAAGIKASGNVYTGTTTTSSISQNLTTTFRSSQEIHSFRLTPQTNFH